MTNALWKKMFVAAIMSFAAAALSILITGFEFGIDNNMFHIPAVLRLYETDNFHQDPFYQSLRNFVSGIYPLLAQFSDEHNIETVFFATFFIARWATFAAVAAVISSLGVQDFWKLWIGTIWLSITPVLVGYSVVGGSGLFIKYFSHTEATHALVLLSLVFAARGLALPALIVNALTFNVNAFVAAWNGFALASALTVTYVKERDHRPEFIRKVAIAILAAVIIASPVLVWIGTTLTAQKSIPTFDFSDFLRFYHPSHVLIEAASWQKISQLVIAFFTGAIAFQLLGTQAKAWSRAYYSLGAVFLIGCAAPYVTSAPLVLNLNLLRVDSLIELLAAIAIIAATCRELTFNGSLLRTSLVILAFLFLVPPSRLGPPVLGLVGATACLLAIRILPLNLQRNDFRIGAAALLTALPILLIYTVLTGFQESSRRAQAAKAVNAPMIDIAAWARSNSPAQSIFLLPLQDLDDPNDFQWRARRREWVNFKSGAAVMWDQTFYATWRRRITEVRLLKSLDDKLGYACANRIHYLVHSTAGVDNSGMQMQIEYKSGSLIVINTDRWCGDQNLQRN